VFVEALTEIVHRLDQTQVSGLLEHYAAIHRPENEELNRTAALADSLELSNELKRLVGQK
jgi:hypothetical protein